MTTIELARRVERLKPSATIVAKQMVADLKAAGRRVIDLTIGEPDFGTPSHITEAAIAALGAGATHYSPTPGIPALREAVAAKFLRENGIDIEAGNVIVGTGAKQLIFEAFAATVEDGTEVVVPAPYWVSYPDMVAVQGGTPVIVACDHADGFKLRPEALDEVITPNTRWLILNSPNNPTGAVYSRSELAALADVLRRHPHVGVITDEIYEHLVYDGAEAVSLATVAPDLVDRTLVVNGVSKAYAMTGWRIGYAAGPQPLVAAISKLIGQSTTCASAVGQEAAVAALQGDQSCVTESVQIYQERRDRMLEILDGAPGLNVTPPEGAFYLYVSVAGLIGRRTSAGRTLETDVDVALHLLESQGVAVLDGSAYGLSPYLRLSFATSLDEVEAGATAIRRACEDLFSMTPGRNA